MIMETYIMYGYELITILFPAAVLTGVFYALYRRKRMDWRRFKAVYLLIFAVYLFGVFHFTGAGTIFDAVRLGVELNPGQINLVPFSDPNFDFTGYVLNIVLFMPLGFLLPFLWQQFRKLWHVAASGFLLSVLVECSQLLNFRATDVDDIILNTLGAVCGDLVFLLYSSVVKRGDEGQDGFRYEAPLFVAGIFLFRFFAFNEFGMAGLLFGF